MAYDEAKEQIYYKFSAETLQMTADEYLQELITFLNLTKQYKPQTILGEMQEFQFSIPPSVQEWVGQYLFPAYQAIGMKKIAMILTQEFIPSLPNAVF